jgi:non-ribosomal peptide synthetase component F
LFQLALATFYAFLFKLTNDENDICITCLDANRYKPELQDMIGMFVATLPCRIQFKPHWSFDELVKYVQEKYLSIREHSHYPLQQILADFNVNNSNVTFLEILFEFKTHMSEDNQVNLSGANLQQISIPSTTENSFVDFEMMFEYDHTRDTGKLGCFLFGSVDHFNETTINKMGRKFEHFYSQLFTTNLNAITIDKCVTPISRLSLILPEEDQEMQGVVFRRLSDIGNKGISISLYDLFHATLILI